MGRHDYNAGAGLSVAYGYNALSQVSQITYGSNNNCRVYGYDPLRRVASDELRTSGGATIGKVSYGYDENGNLTSKNTTGFAGAGANTYTYDLANRLTSWNNTTSATEYAYDKSGNRVKAGARTFSYDSRNQLTSSSDGTTYQYSPRGTLRSTTVGTVSRQTQADAFGQIIRQYSSETAYSEYRYDGFGRVVNAGFAYTGTGNHLAADPAATYIRDPDGSLIGSRAGGSSVFAWTDQHRDVVAQFTATGTTISGSRTFDPWGKTVAAAGVSGSLGYQSEWTDASTGRVNMASRWYNPDTGAFDSRDTVEVSNRYSYVDGNPLTRVDPSGHQFPTDGREYVPPPPSGGGGSGERIGAGVRTVVPVRRRGVGQLRPVRGHTDLHS